VATAFVMSLLLSPITKIVGRRSEQAAAQAVGWRLDEHEW
jgi:hypothetical protein